MFVGCVGMVGMPCPPIVGCVGMAGMPYPPIVGCVGMAGMPYPPILEMLHDVEQVIPNHLNGRDV